MLPKNNEKEETRIPDALYTIVSVVDGFLIATNIMRVGYGYIQVFLGNHLIDTFAGPFCACVRQFTHLPHYTRTNNTDNPILRTARHVADSNRIVQS